MASGIYTEIKKKIELAEPRTELFGMWRFFIWMMGFVQNSAINEWGFA